MNRNARDLGPDDLVWDHFSRPRFDDVPARIRAAADAGFAAIGLYLGAWERLRTDASEVERIEQALAETGLVIANIEVVRGWASPDRADEACTSQEALAFEMADRFGCRYLQAIGNYTGSIAQAATGFASLCDRAAGHGLLVGLEWVPSLTNIENAAVADAIVGEADRPNGGFCFDAWHLTRSTNDLDDLRRLDGAKIFATQFNDGTILPQHPDYLEDCLTNRVPPGRGEFALEEMIRILDRLGSIAPIGLEVCSQQLWEGSVAAAAQSAADGMRSVLSQARPC
ncbi:sugar phosphate isomerase/epimerase family protein [Candidatus Poriferisodalis sp.]|uniref:sugar phosphate isomerase/epimerase family protein n=1 Tax=Candidatus Poriferisodalis sp. TaxID=3101277 RepID=UPI003B0127FA